MSEKPIYHCSKCGADVILPEPLTQVIENLCNLKKSYDVVVDPNWHSMFRIYPKEFGNEMAFTSDLFEDVLHKMPPGCHYFVTLDDQLAAIRITVYYLGGPLP